MISLVVAAVLLLIHALVCLMLWTLMKLGLLPVRGHMVAVIVLVPLWGPLLVVLLSVRGAAFGEGLKESALESLRFNDDLHRSILVHERDADAGVNPSFVNVQATAVVPMDFEHGKPPKKNWKGLH